MLYVVRHGQTDWNNKKIIMGSRNIPLNKKGIEEAYTLKKIVSGIRYNLLLCSPLKRTIQTANIINEDKGINCIYDSRLMERCLGKLEGKPYVNYNDILWDISINYSLENVETMIEFRDRVYSFMSYIYNNYLNTNVLVVTHGGVSALIDSYVNDTLYDGPVSNKFLKNGEIASYDLNKEKILKK